jgi:hypothetical protein
MQRLPVGVARVGRRAVLPDSAHAQFDGLAGRLDLAQAGTARQANCKFDGNAVNHPFVLSQVSTWDSFQPNRSGHQAPAPVSYAAGFGW